MCNDLILSPLGHTWILDIDGTICKHNGYKIDGYDTLLSGVKEFFDNLPNNDKVVFITSRKKVYAEQTEKFLRENGIRYDAIVYEMPYGERILINDNKESGLVTGYSCSLNRNEFGISYIIDKTL